MSANPFVHFADWFFGRGPYGVTIPSMDGALRPNSGLEEASVVAEAKAPDNLIGDGRSWFYSSGAALWQLRVDGNTAEFSQMFAHDITAMAISPVGTKAIALANGSIALYSEGEVRNLQSPALSGLHCITALNFSGENALYLTNGSSLQLATQWSVDLMQMNAKGSLWVVDVKRDTIDLVASNLGFPNGLLITDQAIVVSEAWKHRLVSVPFAGGKVMPVLEDLPGYPGRLAAEADGHSWLCVFAPRSQLIEFVLREHRYRKRMISEVPSEHWIAPSLSSGGSFLEPLQGGGVKQMGILKPWAPTRSYGLVLKLDSDMRPVASYHSRSDGMRHGITSVAVSKERVLVTSRGGNMVLVLDQVGSRDAAIH